MTKKKLIDLIYKHKIFIKKKYREDSYLQGTLNGISSSLDDPSSGLDKSFLFDFKNYQSGYFNINTNQTSTFFIDGSDSSEPDNNSKSSGNVRKKN